MMETSSGIRPAFRWSRFSTFQLIYSFSYSPTYLPALPTLLFFYPSMSVFFHSSCWPSNQQKYIRTKGKARSKAESCPFLCYFFPACVLSIASCGLDT
ncbi:hypothetical protein BDW75DRAFT_135688 [Aspergillus navahoensis]